MLENRREQKKGEDGTQQYLSIKRTFPQGAIDSIPSGNAAVFADPKLENVFKDVGGDEVVRDGGEISLERDAFGGDTVDMIGEF